jgi:hypothetical protein
MRLDLADQGHPTAPGQAAVVFVERHHIGVGEVTLVHADASRFLDEKM